MFLIVNGMVDAFDIQTAPTPSDSIFEAVAYEVRPASMSAAVKALLVGKPDGLGSAITEESASPFAIYQALSAGGYQVVTFDDFNEQVEALNASLDEIDGEPEGEEEGRDPLDMSIP